MTDPTPTVPSDPGDPFQRARTYAMRAPNLPETAKVARDMVAGLLDATGHPALTEMARLLVSELVSNVHLHTGVPLLILKAAVRDGRLTVSVRDGEPGLALPSPRAGAASGDEHGRGLLLVRELASDWGTVRHGGPCPTGKSVWFELRDTPA
ncbi:ATP-binding protein [Streptomyces sp. TRM 70361]|uniref:ATP-binding protein n=1 Tax=Streptomyces sp. TRM 70361 TaxID=3116553 RepID=UPI002E7AC7AE|nr:ATP-binding protein [Streptomyces sp. TRM 70361]MEE1937983.1 ATP-binding protein [Streptomyces sp. TRM 70361]